MRAEIRRRAETFEEATKYRDAMIVLGCTVRLEPCGYWNKKPEHGYTCGRSISTGHCRIEKLGKRWATLYDYCYNKRYQAEMDRSFGGGSILVIGEQDT